MDKIRTVRLLDRPRAFRAVIVAPAGGDLPWTEAHNGPAAISALLDGNDSLWPYAVQNGYRLRWVAEVDDE